MHACMPACMHVRDRLRSSPVNGKGHSPKPKRACRRQLYTGWRNGRNGKAEGQHPITTAKVLPPDPPHRPAANLYSRTMPTDGCTCRPTATMQISTDNGETAHRQPTNAPCTSDKPKTTPCRQTGAATGLPQPWLLQAAAAQAVRQA